MIFPHVPAAVAPLKPSRRSKHMLSQRRLVFGVSGVVLSLAVFGAQGCVLDGDASLGNDGSGADAGSPSASAGTSHGGTKMNGGGSTSMMGDEGGAASDPTM